MDRQSHDERRTTVGAGALGADRTAMQLREVLHNGEAEAETTVRAGGGTVALPEAIEHAWQQLAVDADPGVRHPHDSFTGFVGHADGDRAAARSELQRV